MDPSGCHPHLPTPVIALQSWTRNDSTASGAGFSLGQPHQAGSYFHGLQGIHGRIDVHMALPSEACQMHLVLVWFTFFSVVAKYPTKGS